MKLTKTQKDFLKRHPREELLGKFNAARSYDFVGRIRDLGLIEIDNGDSRVGWPWRWEGTRLTEAGRAALKEMGE